MAERAIRKSFFERYQSFESIPSIYHIPLTNINIPNYFSDMDFTWAAFGAVCPKYKPQCFNYPLFEIQPHIGVQIRNIPINPERNSDINKMLAAAKFSSNLLGYPILVYGANDDILPDGFQLSKDLIPDNCMQLEGELSMLKFCKLMIAPDSGWADLMGWLQVPTLLEQQYYSWGFEGLRPFKPKILPMSNSEDIISILKLTKSPIDEVLLPDPEVAIHKNSHLMPNSNLLKNFWSNFS